MTIALTMKVNDGVVVAADSASTLVSSSPVSVVNVYNNANKVCNLRKGLPIALVTWGLGSIGGASISSLAKDLRRRFSGEDPAHTDWHLDPTAYTLGDVARRIEEFMYDELYEPAASADPSLSSLGFFVVGFSAHSDHSEEYHLNLGSGGCSVNRLRGPDDSGVTWAGQPEAISRLVNGFSPGLSNILVGELGVTPPDLPARLASIQAQLTAPLVHPAMPIQDAIEMAEFLVDLSIRFSKFMPGSPTVGGPIDVAAITKHEGFKWIRRKYYFQDNLNPQEIQCTAAI